MQGTGFRVQGSGCRVHCVGCRVEKNLRSRRISPSISFACSLSSRNPTLSPPDPALGECDPAQGLSVFFSVLPRRLSVFFSALPGGMEEREGWGELVALESAASASRSCALRLTTCGN